MTPPLTILIVTMDRRDILERTLWHIYETSSDNERDIWIWDNASSDDTADFLGTMAGWPGVRVFRSKTDRGIVEPRERMVRHVATPYVLTLDDDWWMLNRGWASGVVQVLHADASICQVSIGPCHHGLNDYGITHEKMDRPFFHMPPILPGPKGSTDIANLDPRCAAVDVGGERLIVPKEGPQLPFSNSGGAAAFRVADLRPLLDRDGFRPHDRVLALDGEGVPTGRAGEVIHIDGSSCLVEWNDYGVHHREEALSFLLRLAPIVDLREAWGMAIARRNPGTREAAILGYGALHPSPGPIWHLGRGERYWEERCRFAQAVYLRRAEEQRGWLEVTRKASGWGQRLDDPEVALK